MEKETEEIKHRLNIVDVINPYVSLKKAGANHKGVCPFHQEKTPSFMVSEEKQIFKCFGCGEGGDIFDFVMKIEGLDFGDTIRLLAERAGVKLTPLRPPEPGAVDKNRLFEINKLAALLWHKILTEHPLGKEAKQYLIDRKLTSETMRNFLIGYVPTSKVTGQFLSKRNVTANEMGKAGNPQRFYERIMFPIFDVLNHPIAFSGRTIKKGVEPKYLNTAESSIFHKSKTLYGLNFARAEIKRLDKAVVVEGQMDVVLSHQAGIKNAVASSGTALTADHLEILRRLTFNVVFAFDQDEAGQKATFAALELGLPLGLNITIVTLEGVKDAGEAIEKDPAIWLTAIENAKPAMSWLVEAAYRKVAGDKKTRALSGIEKKKIAGLLLPYIGKVSDLVEQSHYIKALGARLAIDENVLAKALQGKSAKTENADKPVVVTRDVPEKMLGLLIAYPKLGQNINLSDIALPETHRLFTVYREIKKCYNLGQQEILSCIKPTLTTEEKKLVELLSFEAETENTDEKEAEVELKQLVSRLTQNKNESVKSNFADLIAQAENAGDREKVKQLLNQLQDQVKGKEDGKT